MKIMATPVGGGDPMALTAEVRQIVRQLDDDRPIFDVSSIIARYEQFTFFYGIFGLLFGLALAYLMELVENAFYDPAEIHRQLRGCPCQDLMHHGQAKRLPMAPTFPNSHEINLSYVVMPSFLSVFVNEVLDVSNNQLAASAAAVRSTAPRAPDVA